MRLSALAVPVTAVALAGAAAPQRPDLSGTFVLDRARSTLARPVATIDSGLVRIVHREPAFDYHRVFYRGTRGDTLDYSATTDGREVVHQEGDVRSVIALSWAADTLVCTIRIEGPWGGATNLIRYRLLDGGRTLEARESYLGPHVSYDNVWVFARRD